MSRSRSTKFSISVLLIALFAAGAAHAAGDPKAGKEKSAMCQGCHGEVGIAGAPNFPHLAGQYSQYIERQVMDFQNAKRNDQVMAPMAAAVTDPQDLKDIAAYFSSQKKMGGTPAANKALAGRGEAIFQKGIADTAVYACAGCHGKDGRGQDANNSLFPVIAGQSKDYLLKQMNDFRSGERHNDPAGMMGAIASKMTDAEIDAVTEYLSGL